MFSSSCLKDIAETPAPDMAVDTVVLVAVVAVESNVVLANEKEAEPGVTANADVVALVTDGAVPVEKSPNDGVVTEAVVVVAVTVEAADPCPTMKPEAAVFDEALLPNRVDDGNGVAWIPKVLKPELCVVIAGA